MIDELEVSGLEFSLTDEYSEGYDLRDIIFHIFNGFGVIMPTCVICIIRGFCKPGITLVFTGDGGEFAVSTKALKLSALLNIQAEQNPHTIHVNKISRDTFSLVSAYLNHHNGVEPKEIAKPIISSVMSRIVDDHWDAVFADSMTKKQTWAVISAAEYIDCKSLLHLSCAKIATLIKGKNPAEVRTILSNDDDETDQNSQP